MDFSASSVVMAKSPCWLYSFPYQFERSSDHCQSISPFIPLPFPLPLKLPKLGHPDPFDFPLFLPLPFAFAKQSCARCPGLSQYQQFPLIPLPLPLLLPFESPFFHPFPLFFLSSVRTVCLPLRPKRKAVLDDTPQAESSEREKKCLTPRPKRKA